MKADTGLSSDDKEFFAMKVLQLMTSCFQRRENEYERIGWWEYTGANDKSAAYQDLLAKGLTRTLVAAQAQTASTKTGGDIFLQLIFNMANPEVATDRILNGPTNDRWLTAWHAYLDKMKVDYRFRHEVTKVDCDPKAKKITGVWVCELPEQTGPFVEFIPLPPPKLFTADYYILAVPIEVAAPLLIGDILNGRTIQQFTIDIIDEAIHNHKLDDPEDSIID